MRALRFLWRLRRSLVRGAWDLLVGQRLTGTAAAVAAAVAVAAVSGIGLLGDWGGGRLAILYVIPPLVITVLVHRRVGLLISAEAAVVWAVGDPSHRGEPLALVCFDAGVRFLVVALFVFLLSALRDAAMRARRSEERSRDFLALAAHQLRTPVAGLRASAEALIGLDSSPAQERLLSNLAAEAERAGRLVSRLLTISRLDAREAARGGSADLAVVCAESIEVARGRAPTCLMTLRDGCEGAVVAVDAESCRHILGNLLDNAARHAEGRIDVVASLTAGGSLAIVEVVDDGPGLPAGQEETAFERFVSLDGAGGSGLGLPLSRGLARSFEGDLTYERGRFVLRLPTVAPPKRPEWEEREQREQQEQLDQPEQPSAERAVSAEKGRTRRLPGSPSEPAPPSPRRVLHR